MCFVPRWTRTSSVFEEIDDPEALRDELKRMERRGCFRVIWGVDGIPNEVWVM